ncbi:MAG: peptidase [Nitrosopumilus sp.]
MKIAITAIAAILLVSSTASYAYAEVPAWVKSNAGWWADGTISESEFLSGIEFLIEDGIIAVPPTQVSSESSSDESVPAWVKSNAGWWADGTISDDEFVNGIQYLIKSGLISISTDTESEKEVKPLKSKSTDPKLAELEEKLEKCSEITTAYKRIDCEKPVKQQITLHKYKEGAQSFDLGPITYYWFGVGSEGNEFEISPTGQPLLSIRMLAENTSSEVTSLNCTSPSICSYDVWDGTKSFKYSGMDFTSGQIVLNPGNAREFNILFGPNIGYGGTEFEYDASKSYQFRINEDFGKVSIELNLK